jgi:hypothetical protein
MIKSRTQLLGLEAATSGQAINAGHTNIGRLVEINALLGLKLPTGDCCDAIVLPSRRLAS